MKYYFFAKVVSYEYDQDFYYLDTVAGFASNYAEAAEKVENYFRDSLCEIKSLKLLDSCSSEIFLVPDEMRIQYEEEDKFTYSKQCDEEGELING